MSVYSNRTMDRSGQMLVLVALALTAFIGFAALAIDVGHAYALRRQLQNASDAAALAGTRLVRNGASDDAVWAEVQQYVDYNTNHVDNIAVTAYYTDSSGAHVGKVGAIGTGAVPQRTTGVEVNTRMVTPTFLGRVVGFAVFQPTAVGGARYTKDGPAIFADECDRPDKKVIDWSGGKYYVTGDIRSNGGFDMSGTGNVISNSTISTAGKVKPKELSGKATLPNSTFSTDTSCEPYPVTVNIDDYAPGGSAAQAAGANYHHIKGNTSLSRYVKRGVLEPGIYYVEGNVGFSSPSITALNVTIVATGSINISDTGGTWTPYVNDLLYYTDVSLDDAPGDVGMQVSGSSTSWAGIIYAQNSWIRMSGSSNATLDGSLLGYNVVLTGASLVINSGAAGPLGVYLYE